MTTQAPELVAVMSRLDRLERENRWWKRSAALLAIVAGTGLLMAADDKKSKTSEMEKFLVRDANGRERARLGMGKDGPSLSFLDEQGGQVAEIGISKLGTFLRQNDREGKVLAGIGLSKNGVSLVSYGSTGKLEAGLNAIREDTGPFSPK